MMIQVVICAVKNVIERPWPRYLVLSAAQFHLCPKSDLAVEIDKAEIPRQEPDERRLYSRQSHITGHEA
jgi:hypothetical protein